MGKNVRRSYIMEKKLKDKHFNKDMIPTKDDERNFKNAGKCYF